MQIHWHSSHWESGSRSPRLESEWVFYSFDSYRTAEEIQIRSLRLNQKRPSISCLVLLDFFGQFILETSHHTERSPCHVEKPHMGVPVKNSHWAQFPNHPSPGVRQMRDRTLRWFQPQDVQDIPSLSNFPRKEVLWSRHKAFPLHCPILNIQNPPMWYNGCCFVCAHFRWFVHSNRQLGHIIYYIILDHPILSHFIHF